MTQALRRRTRFAKLRTSAGALAPGRAALLAATLLSMPIVLVGCASKPAIERFFALNDGAVLVSSSPVPALAAATGSASAAPTLPGILVSAVTIPELVDRPQIVTRDSANRVIVSEDNLWAESIKSAIARTLATRLTRALADAGRPAQVGAYPQTSIVDPVLRITVDVVRFDAEPNGQAVVEALWTIRRTADDVLRTGRGVASAPVDGTTYEAIVGGWNRAVEDLERQIAATVLEAEDVPVAQKAGR